MAYEDGSIGCPPPDEHFRVASILSEFCLARLERTTGRLSNERWSELNDWLIDLIMDQVAYAAHESGAIELFYDHMV